MKTLILGSNSFSGSMCLRYLIDNGLPSIGIARNNNLPDVYNPNEKKEGFKEFALGDSFNPKEVVEICESEKVTHIFNFVAQSMVAQSWKNPGLWYQTNVVWLAKLVNALQSWGKTRIFLQFSTPEVYGNTPDWQSENWDFTPSTPYAISRAAGDLHLRALAQHFSFPVIFTRTANIYGPYQPLYRVVPKAMFYAYHKLKFPLDGRGTSVRSFVYMEDVASALLKIAKKGQIGDTYHISTESAISIYDLVRKIYLLFGIQSEDIFEFTDDRAGKDSKYLLDSGKLRKNFNWVETETLESGLLKTKDWLERNISALEQLPLDYTIKNAEEPQTL
jgi:dTDP-glucose 4,6-dehydratase